MALVITLAWLVAKYAEPWLRGRLRPRAVAPPPLPASREQAP
jgi:hypothetical protein